MKIRFYFIFLLVIFGSLGCTKQEFIPDPDDPGLSSFTFKQNMTGTCYINGTPYINHWRNGVGPGGTNYSWPELMTSQAVIGDSIDFSWPIVKWENEIYVDGDYADISFRFPNPVGFTGKNYQVLNGSKVTSCTMYLDKGRLVGIGNLYFVKVERNENDSFPRFFNISGLFDGMVGDSILITKGRFDFKVITSDN